MDLCFPLHLGSEIFLHTFAVEAPLLPILQSNPHLLLSLKWIHPAESHYRPGKPHSLQQKRIHQYFSTKQILGWKQDTLFACANQHFICIEFMLIGYAYLRTKEKRKWQYYLTLHYFQIWIYSDYTGSFKVIWSMFVYIICDFIRVGINLPDLWNYYIFAWLIFCITWFVVVACYLVDLVRY
jgi:hypothetical protein